MQTLRAFTDKISKKWQKSHFYVCLVISVANLLFVVFPKLRFATLKPLSLLCFDHDNAKSNNLRRLPITNINNHCQFQIFAATVIGGFGGINVGAVLAFSAIFLPQLADHVTLSERSWIGKCIIFRTQ